MRHYLLLSLVFLTHINLSSCDSPGQSVPHAEPIRSSVIELRPVRASIHPDTDVKVEVVQTTSVGGNDLKQAHFVDNDNGWVGNRRVLYRTADAGKTWQRLTPQLNPEAHISSFFFINKRHGWLTVIYQEERERYGRGFSSAILVTNDGGNSWSQQTIYPEEVHLHHIAFVDDNNGVAVGARVFESAPPRAESLVVRTTDGGRTWTNLSEQVRVGTGNPVPEYYAKAHWVSPSNIYILTLGGRLMASETSGDTWKMIAEFQDIRPTGFVSSTGFYKLLFSPQGRLAILAGAAGDEGYWGDLVIPNDKNSWTSYELLRVPLRDALFLSEDKILACGQEVYARDEKNNVWRRPQGVIVYSNDKGKSWSLLHHTGSNESLISLTRINDHEFYAISDMGKFMKFKFR